MDKDLEWHFYIKSTFISLSTHLLIANLLAIFIVLAVRVRLYLDWLTDPNSESKSKYNKTELKQDAGGIDRKNRCVM